ncbi:IS481 family transposase [Janibacter sp. G56]|uniref:IS481 family transposase n=1 Tax=Janibacter sp. G56 TaxID=3418717 RepID=UPI003D00D09C
MAHANAPLTPTGRLRLARCVVEDGWPLRRAAERFNVSVTTTRRWADRYRAQGAKGIRDRSSRPTSCPHRTPTRRERRVIGLRVTRRWGPARIAFLLGMNPATVHRILIRYHCLRLRWTDPATGAPLRAQRRTLVRYERDAPGDLVHVDIKKLGRIPDGGGHKVLGRAAGKRDRRRGMGYWYIHNAVDDHTRLAYSELLGDERKETAVAFWTRAAAHFTAMGINVQRVLTDNGACYRSRDFAAVLAKDDITHKRTRPYRPQTNGKVERFNRTLLEEWAYARPYLSETERSATFEQWLHTYNHHRGHTALKGASPADRVPNLPGQYN